MKLHVLMSDDRVAELHRAEDDVVHQQLRKDLRLTIGSVLISESAAIRDLGVPPPGIPTLIVVRNGEVVMMTFGESVSRIDSWLGTYLGLHPRRLGNAID